MRTKQFASPAFAVGVRTRPTFTDSQWPLIVSMLSLSVCSGSQHMSRRVANWISVRGEIAEQENKWASVDQLTAHDHGFLRFTTILARRENNPALQTLLNILNTLAADLSRPPSADIYDTNRYSEILKLLDERIAQF